LQGSRQLAGVRVLLVEDEPLVAMGIVDQLTAAGATIVGRCATAGSAIDILQDNAVDVAVIDFVLADSSSGALQVALESKGVPFVVVTAYPRVLVRRNERQQILSKPVAADLLCSTVKELSRA
jgi:two-component SAPR family response regulator